MNLPKPEPRPPKPPKRVQRSRPSTRRGQPRIPDGLARFRDRVKVADKLWSVIVRWSLGRARCERCRMRPSHDAHHLISRTYYPTRWLIDNGAALCRGCHMLVTRDAEENRNLAIKLLGMKRYEQLLITKHCKTKVDPVMAAIGLRYEAERRGIRV